MVFGPISPVEKKVSLERMILLKVDLVGKPFIGEIVELWDGGYAGSHWM